MDIPVIAPKQLNSAQTSPLCLLNRPLEPSRVPAGGARGEGRCARGIRHGRPVSGRGYEQGGEIEGSENG